MPAGATVGSTCGSSLTSPLPRRPSCFAGGTIPASGRARSPSPVGDVAANASTDAHRHDRRRRRYGTIRQQQRSQPSRARSRSRKCSRRRRLLTTRSGRSTLRVRLARAVMPPRSKTSPSPITSRRWVDSASPWPAVNASTTCHRRHGRRDIGGLNFSLAGGSLAGGATTTTCDVFVRRPGTAARHRREHSRALRLPLVAVTSAEASTNAAATAGGLQVVNATTVDQQGVFADGRRGGRHVDSRAALQIRNNNAGAITLTGVGLVDAAAGGMVVANPPAPTPPAGAPSHRRSPR